MVEGTKYAVLIDAGSSGSRVYVYEWTVDRGEMSNTKIGLVNGYTSQKSNAGIATLAPVIATIKAVDLDAPVHLSEQLPQATTAKISAETLDRVKKYLGPLLDHAYTFIPKLEIRTTPLFILATGGMRRIELTQYDSYQVLLNAINTYLSSTQFEKTTYATISGEDEAMYGWVAANFVDGAFKTGGTPHGFMELGGESAQFAVSIKRDDDHGEYDGPLRLVNIWDTTYDLYVKTWMGIGNDSAWKRHLEKLRASDSVMPLDPCLPKGYSYRLSGSDKIVMGTGDFSACMKEALSLLDCPDSHCRDGDLCIYRCKKNGSSDCPESVGCLLRDEKTGHPLLKFDKEKFSGASVYWHATHGIFRSSGDNEKEDFKAFWDTVVDYSERDWETLKADRPRERASNYMHLRRGFFTAAMVMSTLFLGFGIPMPPKAVKAAREYATERVKYAKIAAENAEEDAQGGSKVAYGALERKLKAAERAETEAIKANAAKEKEDSENGSVSQEEINADIKELKEIFLAIPNEANREDLMLAVQDTERAGDYLDTCKLKAKEARSDRKKAADDAKQAYDKLLRAKTANRSITRMQARICNGKTVDDKLEEAYNNQDDSNKYSSLKDADWTLGRIVLHVVGCTPKIVTKEGWFGGVSD
ncbi:nucleoside phosphatase family-domain-containing protein [Morchella snyderi]|nr:nucleoside phosphatase family-domain-containing protein [Morchella snyderi]